MEKFKNIKGINGAQLKYIAFASMFIDHFNKAIITPFLTGQGHLVTITTIFDILGRIAFPIFAFMIVEGFFKTKSRWKYLRNLLIFALISEIPYDMFQSAVFINTWSQNILWGLALGLFTIMVIDKLKEKIKKKIPVDLCFNFNRCPIKSWLYANFCRLRVLCNYNNLYLLSFLRQKTLGIRTFISCNNQRNLLHSRLCHSSFLQWGKR